ncbi:hypothetical protein THRCLA_05051, partial [Thraustotheca clavata]
HETSVTEHSTSAAALEAKLADAKSQCALFEKRLAAAVEADTQLRGEYASKIHVLEAKITEAENERGAAEALLVAARAEQAAFVLEAEEQHASLETQLHEAMDLHHSANGELAEGVLALEAKLVESTKAFEVAKVEHAARVQTLQENLDAASASYELAKAECVALNAKMAEHLAEHEASVANHVATTRSLETKLSDVSAAHEKALCAHEANIHDLQSKLAEAEAHGVAIEAELANARTMHDVAVATWEAQCAAQELTCKAHSDELVVARDTCKDYEERIVARDSKIDVLEKQLVDLEAQLKQSQTDLAAAADAIAAHLSTISGLEEQMRLHAEEHRKSSEEATLDFETKLAAKDAELSAQNVQLVAATQDNEKQSAQMKDMATTMAEQIAKILVLEATVEKDLTHVAQLESEKADVQSQLHVLEGRVQEEVAAAAKLTAQASKLEDQLREAHDNIKHIESDRAAIAQALVDEKVSVTTLKVSLDALEARMQKAEIESAQTSQQLKEKAVSLATIENNYKQLQETYTTKSNMAFELKLLVAERDHEIAALKSELQGNGTRPRVDSTQSWRSGFGDLPGQLEEEVKQQQMLTQKIRSLVLQCRLLVPPTILLQVHNIHVITSIHFITCLYNSMRCALCMKDGAAKQCSRCARASYCSRECQIRHWNAGHKKVCAARPLLLFPPEEGLPPMYPAAPGWLSTPEAFITSLGDVAYLPHVAQEYIDDRERNNCIRYLRHYYKKLPCGLTEPLPFKEHVDHFKHVGFDLESRRPPAVLDNGAWTYESILSVIGTPELFPKSQRAQAPYLIPRCKICRSECTSECACGVNYCSRDCQRYHYKRHRKACAATMQKFEYASQLNSKYWEQQKDEDERDVMEKQEINATPDNPQLKSILDKWWESALALLDCDHNGTIERDEYVNLYKRLVYGTSRMYGKKAKLSGDLDTLIEEDWQRDSGGQLSMDKSRLSDSVYELAEIWARGQKVEAYVEFLTELHEYVFVSYTDDGVRRKKTPPTKAIKSSTYKPPKTPAISKPKTPQTPKTPSKLPATKVVVPSVTTHRTPIPVTPPDILILDNASKLSPRFSPPPKAPINPTIAEEVVIEQPVQQAPPVADTKLYNSVEARIALQERIEACQKLLQPLTRVSEIAWLRCTAREDNEVVGDNLITALEITGEQVCQKLKLAIESAESAHIQDLTVYVEDAERDVHLYEALVTELAKESKKKQKTQSKSKEPKKLRKQRPPMPATHNEMCFGQHTITYDLPSMKSYVVQVAPSYAAYKKQSGTLKHYPK